MSSKFHSTILFFVAIGSILCIAACKGDVQEEKSKVSAAAPIDSSLRVNLGKLMKIHRRKRDTIMLEFDASENHREYTKRRLLFNGNDDTVPGYLLIPKDIAPPYPVMICLQGHAPGMFISLGEYRNEREKKLVAGGRDLALQAIRNGWAALVIEQKGFGKRQKDSMSCNHQSLQELVQGRTMIGERVDDIRRTVDVIHSIDSLDHTKIGVIGNSSGGTTAYYAAAMDPRINLAVVSCSFSTLATSWLKYPHCSCGYIPDLLEIADMPDLAQLISPRELIIVAGEDDYLADIEGVREGVAIAERFYKEDAAKDKLKLIIGEGGHQFYPEQTWPVINGILAGWEDE